MSLWSLHPKDIGQGRQLKCPKGCVVIFMQLWPHFCRSIWSRNVRPGPRGWVEQHHSLQGERSSSDLFIKLYFSLPTESCFFQTPVYWPWMPSYGEIPMPVYYCIISRSLLHPYIPFTTSLPKRQPKCIIHKAIKRILKFTYRGTWNKARAITQDI